MTSDKAFSNAALATFRNAYPEQPALLKHHLSGHPLFELEALAGLAQRMRAVDVEYNRGDLPVGIDPAATPRNGLSIAETIRSIEECGSWMVLKFIEQDSVYQQLLHDTLAQLDPVVAEVTGKMLKMEGFIFISSPDAVTPFHFDPEHNILLQIRGEKVMTVFPPNDEQLVDGALHEAFHAGGHRNLPWRDDYAAKGKAFPLRAGEAIYVPVKAPHWVKNGPEPSVSFSITWRSEWSFEEADARGFNRRLRSVGFNPASPKRFPERNLVKSIANRAIAKAERAMKREGN